MTSDVRTSALICAAGLALMGIAAAMQPLTLPVAAAMLLVAGGLAAISPLGAVMSVIVTLPFFYRPIEIGSASLAASELLLAAALLGTGVRIAAGAMGSGALVRQIRGLTYSVVTSRLVWLLGILLAAGVVSTMLAYDPDQRGASLRELRWTLVEPLLLLSLLFLVSRHRTSRYLLLLSLAAAGAIAAMHGLLDVFSGGGVIADDVRRLSGPLPHPNALALFLVRPLAVLAGVAVFYPRWRLYTLPPLALTAIVLLGTFSRGAMLAVLTVAILLAFRASPRIRAFIAGSVVAAGGAALAVAGDRMTSALEGGSVSLRIDIWSAAVRMVRDNPLFGYGPDQFLYAYAPRYILPAAWDERFTAHAHNLVLDAWIRLGIVGAIVACIVLYVVFRRAVSDIRHPSRGDRLQVVAVVALAAVLVHGLIDNSYFGHDLAMSAWLLAWLGFSPPGSIDEEYVRG